MSRTKRSTRDAVRKALHAAQSDALALVRALGDLGAFVDADVDGDAERHADRVLRELQVAVRVERRARSSVTRALGAAGRHARELEQGGAP